MERVYSTRVESVSDLSNANLLMRFYLFERHAISTQHELSEKKNVPVHVFPNQQWKVRDNSVWSCKTENKHFVHVVRHQ